MTEGADFYIGSLDPSSLRGDLFATAVSTEGRCFYPLAGPAVKPPNLRFFRGPSGGRARFLLVPCLAVKHFPGFLFLRRPGVFGGEGASFTRTP